MAILFAVWVMIDASKRGVDGFATMVWGLFTFFGCGLVLPIWLAIRPRVPQLRIPIRCQSCGQWTESHFATCQSCNQILFNDRAPAWPYVFRGDTDSERRGGSYDVYAQTLPPGAARLADVPNDYQPEQLVDRAEIVDIIKSVLPEANTSNVSQISYAGTDFSIVIFLGPDPVYVCHIRLIGGAAGIETVATLLQKMQVTALNCVDYAIFSPEDTVATFNAWQHNRDEDLAARS
ncbi:MAG TPA: hypothetical protein VGK19_25930 [Capsulimonadaceae bacterium]